MFKYSNIKVKEGGFAAFLLTVLILSVLFGIAVSVFILTFGEQKILKNIITSNQSYYLAEAGIEDALLRLSKAMNWPSSYSFTVEGDPVNVIVSDIIGGARTITSEGNALNRIRKAQVSYEISSEKTSFYYGAQIGDGGLVMDDGSEVLGNVFSNGTATGAPNTEITGTIWVARNGNKIRGLTIGQDAYAFTCEDSTIVGTLTYVSGGSVINCTAGVSEREQPNEILPREFAISQQQIDDWKNDAASGGTYFGDYTLAGVNTDQLGPIRIEGNMIIQDQAQLSIIGTIWVTGDITIQNRSRVRLDQNSYGSLSGVIVADGLVTLQDEALALGSGIAGSYLLMISTSSLNPALIIQNSFEADILFTPDGWIQVQDTTDAREITGYGINLKNNAKITYEVGLQDASFSSGPGGSWEVTSWKEIQ